MKKNKARWNFYRKKNNAIHECYTNIFENELLFTFIKSKREHTNITIPLNNKINKLLFLIASPLYSNS